MRVGLVGYGTGGRLFHAPFIEAAQGVELAGVVTRSAARRSQLTAERPDVPAFDSLADLLASGVEAVAISTPPATHADLVLEAIEAGVHVVADSPFAPTATEGRALAAAADQAGVTLSVYHQRRRDADIQTVKHVIGECLLGDVWRFHSRYDIDSPGSLNAGPGGGVLREVGSQLVDQALWLFGPAERVHAHLDWLDLPEGPVDCGFVITLEHTGGVVSYLSASKLNRLTFRAIRLYGSQGSYRSTSTDVQYVDARDGRRPADDPDAWGYEPPTNWGQLMTAGGTRTIASAQGRYHDYYTQFAAAVAGRGQVPVPATEALAVLDVLDAARESAAERAIITLAK